MKTFTRLLEALDAEGAGALVRVMKTEGSAPREAGAHMVVRPSGGFHGTIGGGALEWEAIADARRMMAEGRAGAAEIVKSLGPDLAQCCGGRVRLLIEIFGPQDRPEVTRLAAAEARGPLVTARRETGRRDVVATGEPVPDGAEREDWTAAPTPLLLFGAGHVGRALVLALAPLPFAVRWIDPRADAFPPAMPGNVVPVASADPASHVDAAPDGAMLVVMTHSHPLDLDIIARALAAPSRFSYIGLIGSATKRARFSSRLRAAGVSDAALGRLVCPIGIPGIEGKEPAIIAASTAAQLLLIRETHNYDHGHR